MDWLLDRTVEYCSIGVAFGQSSLTDLDFSDDVSLLAELLFVPILETMAREAASLGLEVNWQKTKVQALGSREDMPLTIKVQGHDVIVVKEFVYLGSLIHSSTGSTCDISRRIFITRTAMQSLENQIWRSPLAISTKLKLYNTCILPIFLYGSDCWLRFGLVHHVLCFFGPQLTLVLIAPTHRGMAKLSRSGWLVLHRDGLFALRQALGSNRARCNTSSQLHITRRLAITCPQHFWFAWRLGAIQILVVVVVLVVVVRPPSPLLGYIWDVMLVWRKGNINKTVSVLQYCVPL